MNLSVTEETRIIRLLCFIVPFAIVNSYMLNVALPEIAKEFGTSPSTTSWVVTISGILSALGALIYGKLADSYGKKLGYFWCIAVFDRFSVVFLSK